MKKKLLFPLIIILCFIFATTCFATDQVLLTTANPSSDMPEVLNEDLYVDENNSYSIENKIMGNAFLTATDFIMENASYVDGNLFLAATTATLKSNVNYSENDSKDGTKEINKIISNSQINRQRLYCH